MSSARDAQRLATAEKLLASALKLFDRLGFERTTVDQIVEDAGVAKGTFFHHFASKDAILAWIGEQQMRNVRGAIEREPGFAEWPFGRQIGFVLHTMGEAHAARKGLIKFLAAALVKTDLLAGPHAGPILELDKLLLPLVERGVTRGEVRPDVPPVLIATHIRAAYFQSILTWLTSSEPSYRAIMDPFLELVLRGTRPEGEPNR